MILKRLGRFIPNHADREDLYQTIVVRILNSNVKDVDNPVGYAVRIAYRLWWAELKGQRDRRIDRYTTPSDPHPDCLTQAIFEENYAALVTALQPLSPRCRRIFEMSRVEQYTYEEIAKQFNISANGVKRHLERANGRIAMSDNEFIRAHALYLYARQDREKAQKALKKAEDDELKLALELRALAERLSPEPPRDETTLSIEEILSL